MSATSDKIRKLIRGKSRSQMKKLNQSTDIIVANLRMNKEQGEEIKKVTQLIADIKSTVDIIHDTIDTIKFVQESLEAGRKAAEATEKASSISSALNPAAAAIAYAQKFFIDRFKKETEDIQEVKGEGEQIVEDITVAIDDAQKNLEEAEQKKKEQKKQQDKLNKEINGD